MSSSDSIRAKAEARRQRILDRGSDRIALAKGEKTVTIDERPLAARNILIKTSASTDTKDETPLIGQSINLEKIETDNKSTEEISIQTSDSQHSKEIKSPYDSTKSKSISANISDIHHQNNAKQKDKSVSQNKFSINAADTSTGHKNQLSTASSSTGTKLTVKQGSSLPIQSLMQISRLIIIILFGIIGGFHVLSLSYSGVTDTLPSSQVLTESLPLSTQSEFDIMESTTLSFTSQRRTWIGWLMAWLLGLLTNPTSAVSCARLINAQLKPLIELLWWLDSISIAARAEGVCRRLEAFHGDLW